MSFSPTYLANLQKSRPASNTPSMRNKVTDSQNRIIQTEYNRVFYTLKSQHTIFIALFELVQKMIDETNLNGRDKDALLQFKDILNVIINSSYGNLFQINFAASDAIQEIINPTTADGNKSIPLSSNVESIGFKILSACLSIKRLVSILSFTNYIGTQLRYSKTEKSNNSQNDPELIEAEDDYQFETFDSGTRVSSLGEKPVFPLIPRYQHHKKSHHSKEKNTNQNNSNNKNNSNTQNDKNDNIKISSGTETNANTQNTDQNDNTNVQTTVPPDNSGIPTPGEPQTTTNLNDQISTEKVPDTNPDANANTSIRAPSSVPVKKFVGRSSSEKVPLPKGSLYDNIFPEVDDSTIPDSNSGYDEEYEEESDYYYYDSEDESEKPPPNVICRICEKEVPLPMIEKHSTSCVIAYDSSVAMKSTDDKMRKLQAYAQQTVLHVEWPCNEDYAKSIVIPTLHIVALLDRAISIDKSSSSAPKELDLIFCYLKAIKISREMISSPVQFGDSKPIPEAVDHLITVKKPPSSNTAVSVKFNLKSSSGKHSKNAGNSKQNLSASTNTTPTDRTKVTSDDSPDQDTINQEFQRAVDILGKALNHVNEKKSAALNLSRAIDVFKQTTIIGMKGDLDDVSAYIRPEVTIADFSFIRRISSGAYAKVYLTRKAQTGDLSATKVIHKNSLRQKNDLQRVMFEKNILSVVSSQFMVRFFFSIIGKNNLYLVMEYCPGGDLFSALQGLGTLPEEGALTYTAEVVAALEFLRQKNVIHRDLKPDNILVTASGHLKLTDFGMSAFGIFDRSVQNENHSVEVNSSISTPINNGSGSGSANNSFSPAASNRKNSDSNQEGTPTIERRDSHDSNAAKTNSSSVVSLPGTPDYIAPEIILQQAHSFTADYWSLGCIIYELLTGIPPFHGDTPEITFANILKGVYDEGELSDVSPECVDLIKRLLTRDPKKRLGWKSIDEIKNHPWFTKANVDWNNLHEMAPPFIPRLKNEEDTSYFEERYAMTNDDEVDIREDIDEAKKAMNHKSEKKSQSFFSDEKNVFTDTTPMNANSKQDKKKLNSSSSESMDVNKNNNSNENINTNSNENQNENENQIEIENENGSNNSCLEKDKTNENKDNEQNQTEQTSTDHCKSSIGAYRPSSQPYKPRTSNLSSNSFASMFSTSSGNTNNNNNNNFGGANSANGSARYHSVDDDELSLFPSCSSGSLQTLTIEDSMKKYQKLQNEILIPSTDDFGNKIRVSRSSHNLRKMILNEMNKDKSQSQSQSQSQSPSLKQTQSQIIEDKQLDLLSTSSSTITTTSAAATPNTSTNSCKIPSIVKKAVSNSGGSSRPVSRQSSKQKKLHSNHFSSSSNLALYSNNDSENVYEDDSENDMSHFVESKSVNSLHKKWCLTPDGSKKRRHSHRRSHRSRRSSDETPISSSSSLNTISRLHDYELSDDNREIEKDFGPDEVKDSALISHAAEGEKKSLISSPTSDHDYPLSKFVKSDCDDDDDDMDDDDDDL